MGVNRGLHADRAELVAFHGGGSRSSPGEEGRCGQHHEAESGDQSADLGAALAYDTCGADVEPLGVDVAERHAALPQRSLGCVHHGWRAAEHDVPGGRVRLREVTGDECGIDETGRSDPDVDAPDVSGQGASRTATRTAISDVDSGAATSCGIVWHSLTLSGRNPMFSGRLPVGFAAPAIPRSEGR